MTTEEYAELLEREEWKDKRESILKRDNYTCQKCGRRGFSFRSFKISGYTELNDLMEEWTIKDIPVAEYLKNIEWEGNEYLPMVSVENKYYKNNRKLVSFYTDNKNSYSFITNDLLLHPYYIKYEQKEVNIINKEREASFSVDLIAFKLRRSYTLTSNYIKIFEREGDISILIGDKLFVFRTRNPLNVFRFVFFNFSTLHIHHKYYIEDRCPWEYDDDALITLCSDCHAEVHNSETTPLLSETGRMIYSDLPTCDRCGGSGELSQYKYYMNGICFKCHGTGVVFKDDL